MENQEEKVEKFNLCPACRKPLISLELGGKLEKVFICPNENCPRLGLISVVSLKYVKKEGGDKNALRTKKANKQKVKAN